MKSPGNRSSALLLQALRYVSLFLFKLNNKVFQQLTKKQKLADALPILQLFAEKDILLLKNRKNVSLFYFKISSKLPYYYYNLL